MKTHLVCAILCIFFLTGCAQSKKVEARENNLTLLLQSLYTAPNQDLISIADEDNGDDDDLNNKVYQDLYGRYLSADYLKKFLLNFGYSIHYRSDAANAKIQYVSSDFYISDDENSISFTARVKCETFENTQEYTLSGLATFDDNNKINYFMVHNSNDLDRQFDS